MTNNLGSIYPGDGEAVGFLGQSGNNQSLESGVVTMTASNGTFEGTYDVYVGENRIMGNFTSDICALDFQIVSEESFIG